MAGQNADVYPRSRNTRKPEKVRAIAKSHRHGNQKGADGQIPCKQEQGGGDQKDHEVSLNKAKGHKCTNHHEDDKRNKRLAAKQQAEAQCKATNFEDAVGAVTHCRTPLKGCQPSASQGQ